MPDWSLDGQLHWIGNRHREQGDPRQDIDNYEIVNVTLRRQGIGDPWSVALAVRNLFNEDAWEPSPYDAALPLGAAIPDDYPMERRAIWGEVRVYFEWSM